ncbi:replication factor C subunit 2/4 [Puccinia sorghi]|uniref:Replication factor C subunit 2/4 n=1 Tax=Puccinia sorghi TaxID=27349 RepID=A0A0L6VK83_9BASI|nr:replication factor C subunit 2/4 [Puccinia sorghi]
MNAFDFMRAGAAAKKLPPSADTTSSHPTAALPWIEKYRPKSIDSVQGQEGTTKILAKALNRADLPHMLFYGPPGTGKTSTILALARDLFGPELMKSRVLELNASDERGISVVREKIKNFAKISISPATSGYPCPAYKIIILDEADSMTQDAQSALRRIMENYSKITRFCLICNYVTRIIEPIVSRCSKFRFKPLSISGTQSKLKEISKLESIKISSEVLDSLIRISAGDLRRSITYLQSASKVSSSDEILEEDIREIGGIVPHKLMTRLLESVGIEARGHDDGADKDVEMSDIRVQEVVESILREGYSAVQIINQVNSHINVLHDLILLDPLIPSKPKALISVALGEADKCLNDGADEGLQILAVCLKISKSIKPV